MVFISYAQNFEDVMIWRALQHIGIGHYVDVGANDPNVHSVTRAFYERGWTGINVEPVDQWFDKLQQMRKKDVNLRKAAGAQAGTTLLHEFPDTGLSTMVAGIAEGHEARGYARVPRVVEVDTLTSICRRAAIEPIHFLKIDVEGAETEVLRGLDLEAIRPWIILVESTRPLTQGPAHAEWEPILLQGGYRFAYFDGLNRFYVAREHEDLLVHFQAPPNVFDEFIPAAQAEAEHQVGGLAPALAEARRSLEALSRQLELTERHARQASQRADAAEAARANLLRETVAARRDLEALQHDLETQNRRAATAEALAHRHAARAAVAEDRVIALTSSRCWRYTAPVRWAIDALRGSRPSEAPAISAMPAGDTPAALSPRGRTIHDRLVAELTKRHNGEP